MDDFTMGAGLLLFPQMYRGPDSEKDGGRGPKEQKLIAICPKCGTENDYPYKYCKECGEPSILIRRMRTCPQCGESFDLEKPPVCCPYCTQKM